MSTISTCSKHVSVNLCLICTLNEYVHTLDCTGIWVAQGHMCLCWSLSKATYVSYCLPLWKYKVSVCSEGRDSLDFIHKTTYACNSEMPTECLLTQSYFCQLATKQSLGNVRCADAVSENVHLSSRALCPRCMSTRFRIMRQAFRVRLQDLHI